jgi:molybdopterin-guanine dinucleotide biosynthesis protein A
MRLGAIFAGGQARRFGSDKAAVEIDGLALLDRIAAQLAGQVDRLVVVGRDWPGLTKVPDVPLPGLGPLGALAGALAYAEAQGFADVLTSGCDLPDIPLDLADRLAPGPAVVAGQPLLGLWPATLAAPLRLYLEQDGDRAMRSWITETGARRVALNMPLANINTPEELAAYLAAKKSDKSPESH